MDPICQTAKESLLALGGTADEIAAALAARNVKGVPGDSDDCAYKTHLERVMCAKFPGDHKIEVGGDWIVVDGCKLRSRTRLVTVLAGQLADARGVSETEVPYAEAAAAASPDDLEHVLPDHIWDFIERFDDEKYPLLVTERICCSQCGDSMLACDAVDSWAGKYCSRWCADRAEAEAEDELRDEDEESWNELDDPEFDDEDGDDEEDDGEDDEEEVDPAGEWIDDGDPVG